MPFAKLIELERCPVGRGIFVEHDGHELAVFRLLDGDEVIVTDNSCPHASGNLSAGRLTGSVVTCPWHEWEFDLTTGSCVHSEHARITRYPVTVRDGFVYADVESVLPASR